MPRETKQTTGPAELQVAGRWRRTFDDLYRNPGGAFGDDFSGWDSAILGQPIPVEQMRRWRAESVRRIRSLNARRVLEIGAGSGLLLSQLASDCTAYWATDISAVVVRRLRQQAHRAGLADRVVLRCQPADDLSGLPAGGFDAVVLNSVVQYFPSGRYLGDILTRSMELLAPGGALFVGDVRRLELLPVFRTAVRLGRAWAAQSGQWLRRAAEWDLAGRLRTAVAEDVAAEEELLVDPRLFAAMPGATGVEILLKGGRDDNELSAYRYDVIVHTRPDPPDVSAVPSMAWGELADGTSGLARLLAGRRPDRLRLIGVPNSRLTGPVAAATALAEGSPLALVSALLMGRRGIEPARLTDLAAAAGYRCLLTWSSDDLSSMDAVLLAGCADDIRLAGVRPPADRRTFGWLAGKRPREQWTNAPVTASARRDRLGALRVPDDDAAVRRLLGRPPFDA